MRLTILGSGDASGLAAVGTPGLDLFPKPTGVTALQPFASLRFGSAVSTAVPLNHPIPVHVWVIEAEGCRLAWLTDSYGLPARTLEWLTAHPCDLLGLDTSFAPGVVRAPLKGHGDVVASLAAIAVAGARRALLIHLGHGIQSWPAGGGTLPGGVAAAHDGEVHDV